MPRTAAPTVKVDVSAPATAPVGGRVPVTTRPRAATGVGLPWQTVVFQSRIGGVWRTVGSTATDSRGGATRSLPVGEAMRVRVLSGGRTSTERRIAAVVPPVVLPGGRRGTPDAWWLSRSRTLAYVHGSGSPVRAFAAEGFAWNGRYGKHADFRDVR
jgi:hypothetical protein